MKKGQTIWAKKLFDDYKDRLTEGRGYTIISSNSDGIIIIDDNGVEIYNGLIWFECFFSITPPHEVVLIAEQPKEGTFRVKITKAAKLTYWYSNKIGEEFEVTQSERYSESYQFKIYGMLYLIDKVDCEILQPTGESEFDTPFNTKALSSQEPDQRLFQAALAAMQGCLSNDGLRMAFLANDQSADPIEIARMSFDYAEALINEGKKRGKL